MNFSNRSAKPVQESLGGLQAIKKGDIEMAVERTHVMVRYKNLKGYVQKRKFPLTESGKDEAYIFLLRCIARLRWEVKLERTNR